MKILFLGDVIGRSGRDGVMENVPRLRKELGLDFVIINAENAAHGFGLTDKIISSFFSHGVDCITTGNHVWDQRDLMGYINSDTRVLRPLNYPEGAPGRGFTLLPANGPALPFSLPS